MQVLRWIVGAALFLALLFLSLQNSDLVTLKFYHWWSWQAPLIFVVLIAFAIGVAAGLLAGAMRSARLKRQVNRLRSELSRPASPTLSRRRLARQVPARRARLIQSRVVALNCSRSVQAEIYATRGVAGHKPRHCIEVAHRREPRCPIWHPTYNRSAGRWRGDDRP